MRSYRRRPTPRTLGVATTLLALVATSAGARDADDRGTRTPIKHVI
jgi:hypothetical protein